MSLDTWKAKFYPVDAAAVPEEEAVAHSLRKWRGLRLPMLQEHGCRISANFVIDDDSGNIVPINGSSCALCNHYHVDANEEYCDDEPGPCDDCPLYHVLHRECYGDETAPYSIWLRKQNPEPMIAALEKAQAMEAPSPDLGGEA